MVILVQVFAAGLYYQPGFYTITPLSFPPSPLPSRHFSFSHPLYSPGTFTFFNEITFLLARDFIPDYRYRYIYSCKLVEKMLFIYFDNKRWNDKQRASKQLYVFVKSVVFVDGAARFRSLSICIFRNVSLKNSS